MGVSEISQSLYHLCLQCGSTVFWEPEARRDVIAVAVGSFADPWFPASS